MPQREKTPPTKVNSPLHELLKLSVFGLQDHKLRDLPNLKKVEDRKLPERRPSMLRRESTIEDLEIDRVRSVLIFLVNLLFLHIYFDSKSFDTQVIYTFVFIQ